MGLRYVLLKQELGYSVVDGIGVPQAFLFWNRRYEGLGPSVKLNARRRLGDSGFSALAGGSGALLFGSKDLNRLVVGDIGVPPAIVIGITMSIPIARLRDFFYLFLNFIYFHLTFVFFRMIVQVLFLKGRKPK